MVIKPWMLVTANNKAAISFIGKTGGEIFHYMMFKHNVKHICMLIHCLLLLEATSLLILSQLGTQAALSSLSSMLSTTLNISTSSFQSMSKVLDTWLKATLKRLAILAWFSLPPAPVPLI